MQLQSRCRLRLLSSEGLIRTGGASFKMAHSHGWWQEALLSCHVILFIDLFECPYDMAADFSQASDPSKRIKGKHNAVDKLALEVTCCYFYHFYSCHRDVSLSPAHTKGEGN